MKKYNWILVLLIIACIAGLYGYRTYDTMRTDTEAPVIEMSTEIPQISVQDPKSALMQGITVVDDVDGDVTASLVVESIELLNKDGTVAVGYAAFDSAGNVAKASRNAKYTDYQSPKLTLKGALAYRHGLNFDVLSTVGATDVLDGDIQHRVRATMLEEGTISYLGTHYVQFQVTNSLGDTTTQVFPVEVYDGEQYDATLWLTEYLIYLPRWAKFDVEDYLLAYIFQGEEIDLTKGLPEDYTIRTKGPVMTDHPGVYPLEIRVTYTLRSEISPEYDREYTAYSKLIVVVEG